MSAPLTKDQRMRAIGKVLCPCCDGDGFWGDPVEGPAGNCRACNGSGYVRAELAESLLEEMEE
ncbi:MAG: hypothetical protein RJA36_3570 [Pseudomonadota bacterium]|jgi:DnaJ-class molecular chaperone